MAGKGGKASNAALQDDEDKWKAESDAMTLADAEVIRGDEKRHGKAKEAGERLAKEAEEHAKAMRTICDPKDFYDKSPAPKKG